MARIDETVVVAHWCDPICEACCGSGEGTADGTGCRVCKGKGMLRSRGIVHDPVLISQDEAGQDIDLEQDEIACPHCGIEYQYLVRKERKMK